MEEERRRLTTEVEERRARRNVVSDEIAQLKRAGGEAADKIAAMKELGGEIKAFEQQLAEAEERLKELLLQIPNIPLDDVPEGGEDDAVVLRHVGEPPQFDFEPLDHLDLGVKLDVIDMERAARASGSRFAYLKGDLVLLEFALLRYGLDIVTANGFMPVVPPVLVREEAMYGTGFFPADEQQIYRTTDGDCLVGTARCRWRRCTWTSSSRPTRCRCATPASAPASAARPAPPARTRAASCVCTSSTSSRCSRSACPSSRSPSTS